MTVPGTFRRTAKTPAVLVLHRADLDSADIQMGPGYRLTTPIRTILDILESGQTSFELIEQAVSQAIARGLITRTEFSSLVNQLKKKKQTPFKSELDSLLKKVA